MFTQVCTGSQATPVLAGNSWSHVLVGRTNVPTFGTSPSPPARRSREVASTTSSTAGRTAYNGSTSSLSDLPGPTSPGGPISLGLSGAIHSHCAYTGSPPPPAHVPAQTSVEGQRGRTYKQTPNPPLYDSFQPLLAPGPDVSLTSRTPCLDPRQSSIC